MINKNDDYYKWKREYKLKQKQDKKDVLRRAFLVFGSIIIFGVLIFYWSKGSFQFIGNETNEVEAYEILINDYHIGKGYYKPRLTIKYKHNNKTYIQYKNIDDSSKHKPSGDNEVVYVSAIVTYSVNNPENAKVRLIFN
jgi:hypothetical protein